MRTAGQRQDITIEYGRYMPALVVRAGHAARMVDDWPTPDECPFYE
jgi:hypothetical protein